MNDQFLLRFKKNPNPDFVDGLHEKLEMKFPYKRNIFHRNILRIIKAILLLVFFFFASSPSARAMVVDFITKIGDLWFSEVNIIEQVDMQNIKSYEVHTNNIENIRNNVSFEFQLPTWLPEGFFHDGDIGHASDYSWIMISWKKEDSIITLLIQDDELYSESKPVPVGNIEEIKIGNKSAALIQGNWDFGTGEWDHQNETIRLTWLDDNLVYSLSTKHYSGVIEDLIRIAGSFNTY
jgi:hypothetical protein